MLIALFAILVPFEGSDIRTSMPSLLRVVEFSEIRISTNVVITKCIPRRVIHMQRLMSKHAMSELDQTSLERSASVFLSMLISAANYRSVEDLFCSSAQKAYACDDFRCVFLIFRRRVLYLENYMKKQQQKGSAQQRQKKYFKPLLLPIIKK